MKIGQSRWLPLLLGVGLVLCACSDGEDKGEGTKARPQLLDRLPQLIVADALSDKPSAEFLAVRSRVAAGVTKERREYTRGFAIAGGRGPALVSDITISQARRDTAIALGVSLDPLKEVDVTLANASLEALLAELQKRVPGATSCEAAAPLMKADDCTVALLVLEVKRSEAPVMMMIDGGTFDAGSLPASEGGTTSDAGVSLPDAGPSGPVVTLECGSRDVTGAREIMGRIEASDTWSGKVLVKGDVYVTGGTLTIAPGTEVYMDVDSTLYIGWNNAQAALIADGTPAAPIRICGKLAEPGFWGTIAIESNVTSDSVLRNVLIADGAGENGPALDLDADLTVDNLQIRNVVHSGLLASDFKAGSRQLSVEGSMGPAVVLTGVGAITRFPLGGYFRNNTENVARVRGQYLDGDVMVHNIGIPYVQETTVYTRSGKLTFEAGVDYRFQPDTSLEVGWNNGSAGIHVNGSAAAPVSFRGASDVSASWGGVHIYASVTTDSNFTYANITQAGGDQKYALHIEAPIKLDNVVLRGNAQGMKIGASGVGAGSRNLTIGTTSGGEPLVVHPNGVFGLPTGGMLTGNMTDQIRIEGATMDKGGTIADLGVPYLIPSTLYISGTTAITIAPGTDFLLGGGVDVYVGWNGSNVTFAANGTADNPIRFTGVSATAGYWGSLIVERNVRPGPDSVLNYVHIGHGGAGSTTLLDLGTQVPVTNSRFFDSAGWGITKLMANPTDYAVSNTFENVPSGNVQVK